MKPLQLTACMIGLACMSTITRAGTVTVSFSAGALSGPGGTAIQWTLNAKVSADNQGLALFSANILQAPDNPRFTDIPLANTLPAAMSGFARPDGFTNPDNPNTSPAEGFFGTQVGLNGSLNLYQVGGAQNTLGVPIATGSGTFVGIDTTVDVGIGQSTSGQIIAAGIIKAPCQEGMYTYSIDQVVALVLEQVRTAPNASDVSRADIVIEAGSFTFEVLPGSSTCAADFNRNCEVSVQDLFDFLAAFFAGDPSADLDGAPGVTVGDLFFFLPLFYAGCP